jgi:hypothetical protein
MSDNYRGGCPATFTGRMLMRLVYLGAWLADLGRRR